MFAPRQLSRGYCRKNCARRRYGQFDKSEVIRPDQSYPEHFRFSSGVVLLHP